MRKRRRKDDGFTLIELMIVIAVIGILAVVLIPKMGNVKTSARLTGVDTNFQSVSAAVQSLNDITPTDATGGTNAGGVYDGLNKYFNDSTNEIRNPLTNLPGPGSGNGITYDTNNFTPNNAGWAVCVETADTSQSGATLENAFNLSPSPTYPQFAGMVVVDPWVDTSNVVHVYIVGFDNKGVPISNLTTTINP